jgi:hypothetical protein
MLRGRWSSTAQVQLRANQTKASEASNPQIHRQVQRSLYSRNKDLRTSVLYGSAVPSDPSQLISHGIPKRSTTMPKRAAQNVFSSGITIRPFVANSLNTRSASDVSFIWSDSENPFGSS